jgi:hypothetical protein
LGVNKTTDNEKLRLRLDELLCEINDDYAVERKAALKEIFVEVLPIEVFKDWMRAKGKLGGSHKFPRVIKKAQLEEWQNFIQQQTTK